MHVCVRYVYGKSVSVVLPSFNSNAHRFPSLIIILDWAAKCTESQKLEIILTERFLGKVDYSPSISSRSGQMTSGALPPGKHRAKSALSWMMTASSSSVVLCCTFRARLLDCVAVLKIAMTFGKPRSKGAQELEGHGGSEP